MQVHSAGLVVQEPAHLCVRPTEGQHDSHRSGEHPGHCRFQRRGPFSLVNDLFDEVTKRQSHFRWCRVHYWIQTEIAGAAGM